MALTSVTLSITRTEVASFGCPHLCLLAQSPGGLLSRIHAFKPKRPRVPGDKKAPSLQGVGGNTDIWPMTTNRKIIWNFLRWAPITQVMSLAHNWICQSWPMQNFCSNPLRIQCSNCLWDLYHYLHASPTLFLFCFALFVHLNGFICSFPRYAGHSSSRRVVHLISC